MGIDEALAKMRQYETIVDQHVPENKINTTDKGGRNSYYTIRSACISALAILEGNEEKFKDCLDATKKNNPGMGWGYDFDMFNTQKASNYIVTLAYLVKE